MIANSKVVRALFFLGVVAIPFDAVPGLGLVGELAHEGSFYFFGAALLYALMLVVGGLLERPHQPASGTQWVLLCSIALLGCIALSGLVNLAGIVGATFHERTGFPKFITSACVIVYGLSLAWLTTAVVAGQWYQRFIIPACVSATICVIVCIFERASLSGLNVGPFQSLYNLIHAGAQGPAVLWDGSLNLKVLEGWDKRLKSVSFEPPAFGNFAGLIWPWLACGALMTKGSRRASHLMLLATFSGLIILAQARTGWLLLACDVAAFAALWLIFLPRASRPRTSWIALTMTCGFLGLFGGGIYYTLSYDSLVKAVVNGQSISDLSRFAYQVTAFRIFFENPLFGVGLGQFAFTAAGFMPNWGFLSSEIHASLTFPDAPWPNTYSLYARIGAELGMLGLATWLGIWTMTLLRLHAATKVRTDGAIEVPWEIYALFMSVAAILVSGFTTDTFRTPLIWITLGGAADAIGRAQAALRASAPQKPLEHGVDAGSTDHRWP